MNIKEIKSKVNSEEYRFLRESPYLGDNIILLGLGGSHAYGTDRPSSDLDIRGIATNTKRNILTGRDFEQFVDVGTDTTIYSLDKMIKLLCSCNPNTIEILGLKPEHYLKMSDAGRLLYDNRKVFLSKAAIHSFGGYAHQQLRRLETKAGRIAGQSKQEENILKSIEFAEADYEVKYKPIYGGFQKLYIDKAESTDLETEIFMDINLAHYPLRDYASLWNDMRNIVKSYDKIGMRNSKAIEHGKLAKHMCHLLRLYFMVFDILEKREIITYRVGEHDLLMDVLHGDYLDTNEQPIPEFYEMLDSLDMRLQYDRENTELPEKVDMDAVLDIQQTINGKVCQCE